MPSFTTQEIRLLKYMKENGRPCAVFNPYDKNLTDKCAIQLSEKQQNHGLLVYELTKYGENTIRFYDRVKSGMVKTLQSQCNSCGGC